MDAKLLQRVMDLADRTGDRVIVVNPESGTAHAIVPFDAYEDLVKGRASLRDLEYGLNDMDFDCEESEMGDGDEIGDLDDIDFNAITEEAIKKEVAKAAAPVVEEIKNPIIEEEIVQKIAEDSQKEAGGITPLDVLDDEANEEQYYLEPLE
jgi:hypothetical protein